MEEAAYFNIINKEFKPYQAEIASLYKKEKSFKKVFDRLAQENNLGIAASEIEKEYQKVNNFNVKIITLADASYPELLRNINKPPLGLYILGSELDLGNLPLAIVGTRRAGSYGLKTAQQFASTLAKLGITIVSGLALGIDQAAHHGAVEIKGKTIAVIGSGIDLALNSANHNLIEKILENGGAIVSEFALGTPAMPYHFPLRNRIIAGLTYGTIVIEAPIDSGALITARLALENNREVFVVPGEITNRNFQGSHQLLRQGAKLVTTAEEVLQEFGFTVPQQLKTLKLSPKEEIIYDQLKSEKLTFDQLKEKISFPVDELLSLLTYMEIRGAIQNRNGYFTINDYD